MALIKILGNEITRKMIEEFDEKDRLKLLSRLTEAEAVRIANESDKLARVVTSGRIS